MKSVMVVYLSSEMVHADFSNCLALMMLHQRKLSGISVGLINYKTSLVPVGRTRAVRKALAARADSILFVDSDMIFPPNTLEILVKHDKPVIGATASSRRHQQLTHIEMDGSSPKTLTDKDTGCREVKRTGTGVILIKREVFDTMKEPYFRIQYEDDGSHIGEDFYFCDCARKNGFPIFIDLDLSKEIKHIGIKRWSTTGT